MNLWIKLHLKSAYIFLSFCTQIHHHLIGIFCDIQSHQCQGNTGTDYSGITQCLSFFHRDKNPWRKKKKSRGKGFLLASSTSLLQLIMVGESIAAET